MGAALDCTAGYYVLDWSTAQRAVATESVLVSASACCT